MATFFTKNKFRNRWILIVVVSSILPSLLFLLLFSISGSRKIISERKKTGESISNLLPAFLSEDFSYNDYPKIIQKVSHLKKSNNLEYVEIFNSFGDQVFINPTDYKNTMDRDKILHFKTLLKSASNSTIGKIVFGLSIRDEIDQRNMTLLLIALVCLLFVVLEAFILYKMINKLLTPSNEIIAHLSQLSQGIYSSFNKYLNVDDERSEIGKNYNRILKSMLDYQEKLKQASKNEAIAQTTKMLAHDVRKPFSQIKLLLSAFESFKSNPSLLNRGKADVEKAIKNVESMIADIMDFSREVKVEVEPKSLGNVLDFVIRQVFLSFPGVDINIGYSFKSRKQPLVDEERVARVFSNIIGNAVEAITVIGNRKRGNINITTSDVLGETPHTEIIIFNDGPLFPEGIADKLFESFYTSGKQQGTGLGLASAKKIISLHNGTICARNKEDKSGVEFVVRLPMSDKLEKIDDHILPKNSKEILTPEQNLSGTELLLKNMEESKASYKILLLEDEVLYRAWVKNLINNNPILQKLVVLYDASSVDEALQLLKSEKPDYAIVDIDLEEIKNGYDFLREIQGDKTIASIVHSNRTIKEDKEKALTLGAKKFIPKPLPLEELILFLSGEAKLPVEPEQDEKDQDAKIFYACDDIELIRVHLDDILSQYQIDNPGKLEYELFKTGEELLDRAKDKIPDLVFTDLNMQDAGGILKGYDVIKNLKAISPFTKVYLTSNEPLALSEEPTKAAGGDGALVQPLSPETIVQVLESL